MYYKAASYHWNVEGKDFAEMHDFFGDLYTEIYSAIDSLAEEIRALDQYAPISLMELYNYKTIAEDSVKPTNAKAMLMNLGVANVQMIEALNKLFTDAVAANEQGFADFVAGRLDKHKKHGWMIRSFLKDGE
jgi:starvation-inducible DNA-binding protein